MAQSYSLLFLGHQTSKGDLSLDDSTDYLQLITVIIDQLMSHLPGVRYLFRSNNSHASGFYKSLPTVDAVLFWGVPQIWMSYDHTRLRRITGCRAVVTIWEAALRQNADWCFAFRGDAELTTLIHAPIWKRLYVQRSKQPKTVLIDHWDQNTRYDWTYRIEAWMENLEAEFEIVRYVQHETKWALGQDGSCLARAKIIRRAPFKQWLEATDLLETFIVTHCESYGYAILDMFARGTRVLCPAPLLPDHFSHEFEFDVFENEDQLLTLLRTPPNSLSLSKNSAGLTDFGELVRRVDERFRILLGDRPPHWLARTFKRSFS